MMSEIIISKGKSLENAIDKGLTLMELKKTQVDIEVIQKDKKYFGLFGTKPTVVRLIKKPLIKNSGSEDQVLDQDVPILQVNLDQDPFKNLKKGKNKKVPELGKVWVEGGKIYYKEAPTHYPTISPPIGVFLYKNRELIRNTTALMEKDLLKFEFQNDLKDLSWSISLDSLKTVATLQIEPGYRKTYRLVDQEPSSHIQLEIQLHEEKMINNLKLTQIEQRMLELGINTRIQRLEIQRALETTEPGVFTIAKGIEPLNGVDGWIEFVVNNEFKEKWPKELEDEDVGYRELVTIPHIDKGQLLAIIHHPKSEKYGITVTGEEISPKPPKEMVVHAHRGVNLIDQGTKIVAVKSGRPTIHYKDSIAKISVIPKLTHSVDVEISSDNLQYNGDIEIQGNVNEGMQVVAMMNINISGTVNKSKITAGNRMVVGRDVVNSNLSAGKINQLNERLGILLGRLSVDLKSFVSAIEQVYQSPAFKTSDIAKRGLSSLIRILLEKKFKSLSLLIDELSELILKADKLQILDSELKEIQSDLVNGFLKVIPTQFRRPENIVSLVEQIEEVYELISISQESVAHMEIPYALNSELYCSGDISIVGNGCMNSNIYSGGKVQIQGVLRGGEVFATMGIEAEKTGSIEGTITRIIVPAGQTIKINHAMKETVIQIGSHSHKFVHSEQNVFARVNQEDQLLLF
jgi:uncharacterized protein (DUF342 family)